MKTIRPERVFRCTGCGLLRYYLNRDCHTCAVLARRRLLRGTWGRS